MNERELKHVLMRAQQERAAAEQAIDVRSAAAHRQLAERYESVAKGWAVPGYDRTPRG